MSDDKMFDFILARSRTRESSTLTIATVAASASLVLFALFLQEQIEKPDTLSQYRPWVEIMGIAFAGVGIAYREVTARFIGKVDEDWLFECVKKCRKDECKDMKDGKGQNVQDPLKYCKSTGREPLLRSLLSIPIFAWAFSLNEVIGTVVLAALGIGYVLALSLCERREKKSD